MKTIINTDFIDSVSIGGDISVDSLSPNQAVATNAEKELVSIPYSSTSSANSLVQRNSSEQIDTAGIHRASGAVDITCDEFSAHAGSNSMTLNSSGLELNGGLFLPSSGGTPSALNFYEEYSETGNFSPVGGGPWASAQTGTVYFIRIGKIVHCQIPDVLANGNSTTGSIAYSIPARFRPSSSTSAFRRPVVVRNNATSQTGLCNYGFPTANALNFSATVAEGSFSATTNSSGVYRCSLSWIIE